MRRDLVGHGWTLIDSGMRQWRKEGRAADRTQLRASGGTVRRAPGRSHHELLRRHRLPHRMIIASRLVLKLGKKFNLAFHVRHLAT